jgi:hypothetical protein
MPYVTVGRESSGNIAIYYKNGGRSQPEVYDLARVNADLLAFIER